MNNSLKKKEVAYFKKKIFALSQLTGGAFTKLLQSLLDGSNQIIMIPAYPLLYLPQHFLLWKKKYKNHLTTTHLINLILKHHSSLISSKNMRGYNGLSNLGPKKNQILTINKNKFKNNLKFFLNQGPITLENTFVSTHLAYWKTKKYKIDKNKILIFHTHDIYSHEILEINSSCRIRNILTVRDIIPNFSRRLKILNKIDNDRYNKSDILSAENYHYYNILEMWFRDKYRYTKSFLKSKKNYFIKFEDLKKNPEKELKSLCKFLKIKFDKKIMLKTTFDNKKWWNDKIYGRKPTNIIADHEIKYDNNYHFNYEFYVLESLFLKKRKFFGYENVYCKSKKFLFLKFFLFCLMPAKYELRNFFKFFNIRVFFNFVINSYLESKNINKLKDYYSSAFYYIKKPNKNMVFINKNPIRFFIFKNRNQNKYKKVISIIYFLNKMIIYPFFVIEVILLYLKRIFISLKYYLI